MKSSYEEPGGTQIQVGANAVDAYDDQKIVDAFYDAAAALDEKGVSGDGRVAVLSPRQYYSLIQGINSNGLINRDETAGSLQNGNGIISIAGIKIFKSMNIPFQGNYGVDYTSANKTVDRKGDFVEVATEDARNRDIDTDAGTAGTQSAQNGGIRNDYGNSTDFAGSCGLIFQREGAGCVEAIAPQVQVTSGDVSVIYQGDVILGRLAMGADYLNPAACVELHTGAADSQFGTVQSATNNAGYQ